MNQSQQKTTDREYFNLQSAFRSAEDAYFADPADDNKARTYEQAYSAFKQAREERELARRGQS